MVRQKPETTTVAALVSALVSIVVAAAAAPSPLGIVVCAPGYPGSTAEAASVMSEFADTLASATGAATGAFAAEYHETEAGGIESLARPEAGFLLAPLAFYLQHEAALRLSARAQAVVEGSEAVEQYALVAAKGQLRGPAGLAGWEIVSSVGYAPRFVRGPVLGGWGELPGTAKLVSSGALLSALRRAAAGERVAVLLDREAAAGLTSLPSADKLEVVTRSAPLPAFVIATVGNRVPAERAAAVTQALLGLGARPGGQAALAAMRLARFVPLDEASLARARRAFQAAAP